MPDPASLAALGLVGLFLAALLAGSVLPFPSEVVLVALVAGGVSAPAAVAVATAGNLLGAVTVYLIGRAIAAGGHLGQRLEARWGDDPERLARARARVDRWGAASLLLSWVPFVGDALVLAAGLARVEWRRALACTFLGKAGRYAVVAWGALALASA